MKSRKFSKNAQKRTCDWLPNERLSTRTGKFRDLILATSENEMRNNLYVLKYFQLFVVHTFEFE
jgi:hypothetical protein